MEVEGQKSYWDMEYTDETMETLLYQDNQL